MKAVPPQGAACATIWGAPAASRSRLPQKSTRADDETPAGGAQPESAALDEERESQQRCRMDHAIARRGRGKAEPIIVACKKMRRSGIDRDRDCTGGAGDCEKDAARRHEVRVGLYGLAFAGASKVARCG